VKVKVLLTRHIFMFICLGSQTVLWKTNISEADSTDHLFALHVPIKLLYSAL